MMCGIRSAVGLNRQGIVAGMVCVVGWAAAVTTAAENNVAPKWLYWRDGHLQRSGASASPKVQAIVDRINAGKFDAALQAIEAAGDTDISKRDRAALALAVAGHPDVYDPSDALTLAERLLGEAIQADGNDTVARRILNQIELYRTIPWSGLIPDPNLLPARDLVADDKLEAGRKKATVSRQREVALTWMLASFFEDRQDLRVLLEDAAAALKRAGADTKGGQIGKMWELLDQARRHDWARLSVGPESLLYPRVLLERMRTYYWWWRQMGERYRPMSKQGFFELLAEIRKYFPNHDIVRMYNGQRVAWGQGFRPDPIPAGAPGWAVNQRELRARCDAVVEWWLANRQAEDGSLGGGWEDDCETLRSWSITSIACGNEKIEAGIRKLVDGIWTSGELVNGYDRAMKDVEHSSEMSADTSVMLLLAYGDPLYFERFLATTKTTVEVHTGINARGHRHYRSMKFSATEIGGDTSQRVDALYCGRAMRPAAMVAWYSGMRGAVDLVHEWARAWNEDTLREGPSESAKGKSVPGKPAGIVPAVIGFSDGGFGGRSGNWWSPGLGDLYEWHVGNQDMVIGKMLGAWMMTGDDSVLAGLRKQFSIARRFWKNPQEDAAVGSRAWAGRQVVGQTTRLVGAYRCFTGDEQFDDLLAGAGSGYARFLADGDPGNVEAAHAADLSEMRFNWPMITSEVRGTDRVALRPASLLGPLTGSSVSITEPPPLAVTWRSADGGPVGPEFTALVRRFDAQSLSAWVYAFGDRPIQPAMRLWRLVPGRYTLQTGPDEDGDGKVDGAPAEERAFVWQQRADGAAFTLPAGKLWLVEVVQDEVGEELPKRLADLAVMARDISLDGPATVGKACAGKVVVHNIGSADAEDVLVTVRASGSGDAQEAKVIGEIKLRRLTFAADLTARRAEATFSWTPGRAGEHRVEVTVAHRGDREICSSNNVAAIRIRVKP